MNFGQLPPEVVIRVFDHTSARELLNFGSVCKYWYEHASDDFLWRIRTEKLYGGCDIDRIEKHPFFSMVNFHNDCDILFSKFGNGQGNGGRIRSMGLWKWRHFRMKRAPMDVKTPVVFGNYFKSKNDITWLDLADTFPLPQFASCRALVRHLVFSRNIFREDWMEQQDALGDVWTEKRRFKFNFPTSDWLYTHVFLAMYEEFTNAKVILEHFRQIYINSTCEITQDRIFQVLQCWIINHDLWLQLNDEATRDTWAALLVGMSDTHCCRLKESLSRKEREETDDGSIAPNTNMPPNIHGAWQHNTLDTDDPLFIWDSPIRNHFGLGQNPPAAADNLPHGAVCAPSADTSTAMDIVRERSTGTSSAKRPTTGSSVPKSLGKIETESSIQSVFEVPVMELAEQLTMMCAALYRKIHVTEFLHQRWVTDPARAANLKAFMALAHNLKHWIGVLLLVKAKSKADKIKMLQYIVELLQACFDLKNYTAVRAILHGLEATSVKRLVWLWEEIDEIHRKYKKLNESFALISNNILSQVDPPCIPCLPTQHLLFYSDLPDEDSKKRIHFTKYFFKWRTCGKILRHQRVPFSLQVRTDITKFLAEEMEKSTFYSTHMLHQYSMQFFPKHLVIDF